MPVASISVQLHRKVPLGEPLRFAIRAALQRRGLSRLNIAGQIFAFLASIREKGITRGLLKVICAILQHLNVAHNRVFASVAELAATANVACSTVEQSIKLLIDTGAISAPLTGEELYHGDPMGINDGPHKAKDRGVLPQGFHMVNTYDVTGFFYCLTVRERIDLAEAAKKVDKSINTTDVVRIPFSSPEKKGVSSVNRPGNDSSTISLATPDTRGIGIAMRPSRARDEIPPPGVQPRVSSVGIGIGNEESKKRNEVGTNPEGETKSEVNQPGRAIPYPKNRGTMDDGPHPEPSRSATTGEKMGTLEQIAVTALQLVGLRPNRKHGNVPREIVKTMSAKWALRLVEFWHWHNKVGTERKHIGPGYLVNMWEAWSSEPDNHGWDEDFRKEMNREGRAICSTITEALARHGREDIIKSAKAREKKDAGSVVAPVAVPSTREPSAPKLKPVLPPDWLPDVPDEEAKEIWRKAVHLIRLKSPGENPLSEEVRDLARGLWMQLHPKSLPPWKGSG